MVDLRSFQEGFIAALRGAPVSALGVEILDKGIDPERRLDIYRNNVFYNLGEALRVAFPVVEKLVGEPFFKAMAQVFLETHMPRRGTLIGFGESLPDFIETFQPAQSVPYLGDVARLEVLHLEACHAADAFPIPLDAWAAFSEEALACLKTRLHPSCRFLDTSFPAMEIWQAHMDGGLCGKVDMSAGGASLFLYRSNGIIHMRKTGPGETVFLKAIHAGRAFGEAVEHAFARESGFDLQSILGECLGAGVFVDWVPVNQTPD